MGLPTHAPTRIDDLATPAVLVDQRRLETNLVRMQTRAATEGVALRPHTKTHRSVAIARRQRAQGARGLTVAKVGEAEVYADAGFDDLRIAYCLWGAAVLERVAALKDRARVTFCVDSAAGIEAASGFFRARGVRAEVLLAVDTGYGREGTAWDGPELLELGRAVERSAGLSLVGVLTHAGHSYHGPRGGEDGADGVDGNAEEETADQALRRVAAEERDRTVAAAQRLLEASAFATDRPEISIGSTPTASVFQQADPGAATGGAGLRVTEIRPGNYVFHDRTQVALGACELAHCAQTVLATVVHRRQREGAVHVLLDAGRKTLTSDTGPLTPGYGLLLAPTAHGHDDPQPWPGAAITGLSEEHAWCRFEDDAPQIGDRLRVVPNHSCVVQSTQDSVFLVEADRVLEELPVDARGRSR